MTINLNELSILRLKDVVAATGLPKSSLYERINAKELTPPIRIGARRVGWPTYEIIALNKALIGGASSKNLQSLVSELLEKRKLHSEVY